MLQDQEEHSQDSERKKEDIQKYSLVKGRASFSIDTLNTLSNVTDILQTASVQSVDIKKYAKKWILYHEKMKAFYFLNNIRSGIELPTS